MPDHDREMERLRWPGGVVCASCGSSAVSGAPAQRRCRACRNRFTWRTGTAIHSTKLSAAAWRAAAEPEPTPAAIRAATGVSSPTARRMAEMFASVGDRDATPEQRLRRLLSLGPPTPRAERAARRAGAERLRACDLSRCERRIVNALRHRPCGTILHGVATLSGVSSGHARRCLHRLAGFGVAHSRTRQCQWGYGAVTRRLWALTYNAACADVIAALRMEPPDRQPDSRPRTVPPRFWSSFWSTPAQDLRTDQHALLIAQTLVAGPDPAAALWALACLPVAALDECRRLHGFGAGAAADSLDAFIASRSDLAPGGVSQIADGPTICGMPIGSIPDLLASKLSALERRRVLRDYVDLAAIDTRTGYTLEDGIGFYCERYGCDPASPKIAAIVEGLAMSCDAPTDPMMESYRPQVAAHLGRRARDLARLATRDHGLDAGRSKPKAPPIRPRVLAPPVAPKR